MSKAGQNGTDPKKNGHKPPADPKPEPVKAIARSGKNGSSNKSVTRPKAASIEKQKKAFIVELKKNGGIVSRAREVAGLTRMTAYDHFKRDPEFADQWLDALEVGHDTLYAEALKRATVGDRRLVKDAKGKIHTYYEKSDTMLIYLLKTGEAQKKWRNRLISAGTLAVKTVREEGLRAGLTEAQIMQIQTRMVDKLNDISLI